MAQDSSDNHPRLPEPEGQNRLTRNDFRFPGDPLLENAPPLSDSELREQIIQAFQRSVVTGQEPVTPRARNLVDEYRVRQGISQELGLPPPVPVLATTSNRLASNAPVVSTVHANQPVGQPSKIFPTGIARPVSSPITGPSTRQGQRIGRNVHQSATLSRNIIGQRGALNSVTKQIRYGGRLTNAIVFDFETTGLNFEIEWNTSALSWEQDIEKLAQIARGETDVRRIVEHAKTLPFYQYFERIGPAQLAVTGGVFRQQTIFDYAMTRRRRLGLPTPARITDEMRRMGTAIWSNNLAATSRDLVGMIGPANLPGVPVIGSKSFMLKTGSMQRSLQAHALQAALTPEEVAVGFFAGLQGQLKNQGSVLLANQNVYFDLSFAQALALRHSDALIREGLDPLMLINAYKARKLSLYGTEDAFFNVLRTHALIQPGWAQKNLVFGSKAWKHYRQIYPLAAPGAPIPISLDAYRVAGGAPSMLRGMVKGGWKLENYGQIFSKYVSPADVHATDLTGLPVSVLKGAAHEGILDIARVQLLESRFSHVTETYATLRSQFGSSLSLVQLEAAAFAHAGLLGAEFGPSASLSPSKLVRYTQGLISSGQINTAEERLTGLWSEYTLRIANNVAKTHQLNRAFQKRPGLFLPANQIPLAQRAQSLAIQTFSQVIDQLGALPANPQLVVGFAAAGAVLSAGYMSITRRNKRVNANLPPVFLPGMQGVRRPIPVPFGSPWKGPQQDESQARQVVKVGLGLGAYWASQNVWGLFTGSEGGRRIVERAWFLARWIEDITPWRIGRVFGLSSNIGSFLIPQTVNVKSGILQQSGILTDIGRIYSKGLGISERDLEQILKQVGPEGLQFVRRGIGPYHTVDLSGFGPRRIHLFHAGSRRGTSFAIYDANEVTLRLHLPHGAGTSHFYRFISPTNQEVPGWVKKATRGLWNRSRWFRNWYEKRHGHAYYDRDVVARFYRRQGTTQPLYIPGFEHPLDAFRKLIGGDLSGLRGLSRMAGGTLFDWHRSVWGLMRNHLGYLGVDIGSAPNLRRMLGKTVKIGGGIVGGVVAFTGLNRLTGGLLTAPFWNIRDRLDIWHSRVSDWLRLTSLKKRQKKMGTYSSLAWGTLPLAGYATGAYLLRASRVGRFLEDDLTRYRTSAVKILDRISSPAGQRTPRELAWEAVNTLHPGKNPLGKKLESLFFERLPGKSRRLNIKGWAGLGLWAVSTALFLPFLLGSSETEEETRDKLSGRRKVAVRSGRWWEFGSTPFEGGKVKYYRLHASVLRRLHPDEQVPGGGRGPVSWIKTLIDPYWREKESYQTRPYPISSTPFQDIPIIGGLLARTLGRFFKPPKLMHQAEWKPGDYYQEFGQNLEPSTKLGGLSPSHPTDPLGWRAQIRGLTYNLTELMGLRGFVLQSTAIQALTGQSVPFQSHPELQAPHWNSLIERYWRSETGGALGQSELFRRLFPRPEESNQINPLQNQMPSWMPGEDYIINFKTGDPYSKIQWGEARLPGRGFESIHPSLRGINPENYPAWARAEILGDVAPWSPEYEQARRQALSEAGNNPYQRAFLEEIESQAGDIRHRKEFAEESFREKVDRFRGTISGLGNNGTFRLAEYPNHTFRIAGADFSLHAVADQLRHQNSWTKDQAIQVAAEREERRIQDIQDRLLGREVSLAIHHGGLGRPDVNAEVFVGGQSLAQLAVQKGWAGPTEGKYQAGPLGRLYGRTTEFLAHLPQKIPGPFFVHTKLNNVTTAIEAYRRDQLYGTEERNWSKPWENFLRPYLYQGIAKITPGDFVPPHTEKRWAMDTLYDRLAYLKAQRSGDTQGMGRTAIGADLSGPAGQVAQVLPYRERSYFEAFAQETAPEQRETILGMVSQDMQKALIAQWTAQYNAATGQSGSRGGVTSNPQQTAEQAARDIHHLGYRVPRQDWVGWQPEADLTDIQAIHIQHEAMNQHDFNIWDDRLNTLHRKPYLRGAVEHLTSRLPSIPVPILSNRFSSQGIASSVAEHISYFPKATVQIQHHQDWSQDERRRRRNIQEYMSG